MKHQSEQVIKIIQSKAILPRMAQLGITQYRLAKLTGISQATLSEWFSGKIDISLSKFFSILIALQINPFFVPKELDSTDYPDEQRINFN